MTWRARLDRRRISLHTAGRISEDDALRQTVTAETILSRLEDQPGVVLADEVGMGKTFVALAVAVSVIWARPEAGPVVVMVPPSLKDKWPRDFEVFRSKCLQRAEDRSKRGITIGRADSGLDFFRLLDDPTSRRAHLIFLSHGALSRGLTDPWTKLAILQSALEASELAKERKVFHRFAAQLLQVASYFPDSKMFAQLLEAPVDRWRGIISRYGERPDDDPVPAAIGQVLERGAIRLDGLRAELQALPLKSSEYIKDRLGDVRSAMKEPLTSVWQRLLGEATFQSPLLILDEAHHLKNPETQLASLFVAPEAAEEADLLDGALKDRFERMLLLTATPFQLGHQELLNVLDRFRGIRWQPASPRMTDQEFGSAMRQLSSGLDEAQLAASALDKKWNLLRPDEIPAAAAELEEWWRGACENVEGQSERFQVVHRAYKEARERLATAEGLLRPWVIRHTRPRDLPDSEQPRRVVFSGSAISEAGRGDNGLPIDEHAMLPFLLVARCESVLSARDSNDLLKQTGRTVFGEGLASSYEAYLQTRKPAAQDDPSALVDEDSLGVRSTVAVDGHGTASWYLDKLQRALPRLASFGRHPKIRATADEAVRLWKAGEKVLIFCHFRETGRALRGHVSAALDEHIKGEAAKRLGCGKDEVEERLETLGRYFDPRRPLHRQLGLLIQKMLGTYPELSLVERGKIEEVVRRFVRTPSFLIRYFPMGKRLGKGNAPLAAAFSNRDGSGMSLRQKVERFVEFIAKRCEPSERTEYLDALDQIQTGLRYSRAEGRHRVLLPNVRLANGEVPHEERRRLLLAFNAPFFPEILIASSVLAEGVDLHLDCRYVIHHDLSWNPSTLEQRTGRVDRIGCKAERVGKSIHVYLPFIGGTQDEKMYRVVRDRERWFHVVMGEKYALDEVSAERMADRLPLPEAAARVLALGLEVYWAS